MKMRFVKSIVSAVVTTGLLLGNSAVALATEPGRIEALREIEARRAAIHLAGIKADPRYRQTLELCYNNFGQYGRIVAASANDIFALSMGDASAWTRFIPNQRMAPEVRDLLESEAFMQGLRDCDPDYKTIPKIAAADYVGKFAGLAGSYFIFRMGALSMFYLGTWGAPRLLIPGMLTKGAIAQKGLLVYGFGYLVQHMMKLGQTVASTDQIKADSKSGTDKKTVEIQNGISKLTSGIAESYRLELNQIESILRTDQRNKYSAEEIQAMEDRANRIRNSGVLN